LLKGGEAMCDYNSEKSKMLKEMAEMRQKRVTHLSERSKTKMTLEMEELHKKIRKIIASM